jgi:dihydropteroate synthase
MIRARPLPLTAPSRRAESLPLAGGPVRFCEVEILEPGRRGEVIPARDLAPDVLDRLTAPRAPFAGLTLDRPRIMGILNVTPDSFSDGGRFDRPEAALAQARAMAAAADLIDVGGESTRPGAAEVAAEEEVARTAPVIAALRGAGLALPISIDTRKARVAEAALRAGADAVNDVSALTHDPALAPLVAREGAPVVLMHHQGTPATMQAAPHYGDVLVEVFDWLAAAVARAEAAGIARARIVVDPGIGFGKTVAHNLALLRGLSLFHALGLPVLLGASRKRFIGAVGGPLGGAEEPAARMPGSLAVALAGLAQGVQILRVHDVAETRQAMALWKAVTGDEA